MKCIYCSHDSKKSERTDGQCPSCHRSFAFDPTTGDPTDAAFKAAIERVSGQGRVRFTPDNLFFELGRSKFGRGGRLRNVLLLIGVGMVIYGFVLSPWVLLPGVILAVALSVQHAMAQGLIRLERDKFAHWLSRWTTVHGLPAGLIEGRALPAATSVTAMQSELEQYSFDRVVICDTRETVDLLLANNFHFENNCAVLSIGGYPQSVFDIVLRMLKRNPKLQIFALHDATLEGCGMAHRLAHDPSWFAGLGKVVDVGLRPAHAEAFSGLWEKNHGSKPDWPRPAGVTESEYSWLRDYRLSLAAVRPEQVVKRLFRAISERKSDSLATTGGGVTHSDIVIFSTDATSADGGGDSFG
jgi:hypothetical protein